jgi:hypothetical protein
MADKEDEDDSFFGGDTFLMLMLFMLLPQLFGNRQETPNYYYYVTIPSNDNSNNNDDKDDGKDSHLRDPHRIDPPTTYYHFDPRSAPGGSRYDPRLLNPLTEYDFDYGPLGPLGGYVDVAGWWARQQASGGGR